MMVDATTIIAIPSIVTVPVPFVDQESSTSANGGGLRSCLVSVVHESSLRKNHRVRFAAFAPLVHDIPVSWQQPQDDDEVDTVTHHQQQHLWYNGNEIRRMKQAAVPILQRLDRGYEVPQAIEVNWQTGTTSLRGLEFGSRVGQQRKRAALQCQRLVLQEQARLRQEVSDHENMAERLAAYAAQSAQPAVDLALHMAMDDAAFVCDYVENVARTVTAPPRTPPVVVTLMRRMMRTARHNWQQRRRQHKQQQTLCGPWDKTKKHCNIPSCTSDGRPRCDTESTTTIMAACS